jgi:putative solute:sodium symporter small subunit
MAKSSSAQKTAPKPAPAGGKGSGGKGGGKPTNPMDAAKAKAYWRRNITIIGILLTIWFVVSYLFAILFANILYGFPIGQIPASFWFAQQGAIIVFVLLIFSYCWIMDRVDKEFDVQE